MLGEGGGGKGRRDWEEAREKHGVREGRMSSGGAGRVGGESSAETAAASWYWHCSTSFCWMLQESKKAVAVD